MKHVYMAIVASFLAFSSVAQSVANFEDLTLEPEKFWNGSDESGSFKSGGIDFNNSYSVNYQSWIGFAYSNMTDSTKAGYTNQYSAITGKGFEGSSNYAVCYPSPTALLGWVRPTKISGFYVTNSTYAYLSMKNGDQFSKKFGGETGNDPDYFELKIEALTAEGMPIDSVSFLLADFRFTDNSKDYILNKWTWVDLGELDECRYLRFSLSSSDNWNGYMNTPGYFCMDNFNGQKPFDYQRVTYAGFEDLVEGSNGYYNGSDLKGDFSSGNFRFLNSFNEQWGSWSGFAVSEKTDATTPGYENQYSAITGKGVAGTSAYSVGYPVPVSTIAFKDTIVSGVYVTNSTYAYLAMKNGDAYSKKFGGETGNDEDWLMLTIEGFNSENKATGKVEFFLADFAYSINTNDYILDSWKWVNLKSLGRISRLEFSLRSTDNGLWGMNTPGYFCIDNLNQQVVTSSPAIQHLQALAYPNPFDDQITFSGLKVKARAVISDISGRTVREYFNISNNEPIKGLGNLKPGIYIVKITEGGNLFTTKLVKK